MKEATKGNSEAKKVLKEFKDAADYSSAALERLAKKLENIKIKEK